MSQPVELCQLAWRNLKNWTPITTVRCEIYCKFRHWSMSAIRFQTKKIGNFLLMSLSIPTTLCKRLTLQWHGNQMSANVDLFQTMSSLTFAEMESAVQCSSPVFVQFDFFVLIAVRHTANLDPTRILKSNLFKCRQMSNGVNRWQLQMSDVLCITVGHLQAFADIFQCRTIQFAVYFATDCNLVRETRISH